jgi:hypothetical protein
MLTLFDWLKEHRFQSITRRENDWLFAFDGEVRLTVECLWRLIEAGHIRITNQDHGQQFGLPAPVDVLAEVNSRLAGAAIQAVKLEPCLLDLELRFSSGHVLQIIPESSGYEAWQLTDRQRFFIAGAGGELMEITAHGGD